MCDCYILMGNCFAVEVGYRLDQHTEVWGASNTPHGKGEVKPKQMLVAGGVH